MTLKYFACTCGECQGREVSALEYFGPKQSAEINRLVRLRRIGRTTEGQVGFLKNLGDALSTQPMCWAPRLARALPRS
jgi:hypothetical protein